MLGNLQVVFVPFAAWAVLSEAPGRRILAALPLTLIGVVLISGALEDGAYGAHPARGVVLGALTGLSYAGFILLLRHGTTTSAGPPGRCSTRRGSRRSPASPPRSRSATTTSSPPGRPPRGS